MIVGIAHAIGGIDDLAKIKARSVVDAVGQLRVNQGRRRWRHQCRGQIRAHRNDRGAEHFHHAVGEGHGIADHHLRCCPFRYGCDDLKIGGFADGQVIQQRISLAGAGTGLRSRRHRFVQSHALHADRGAIALGVIVLVRFAVVAFTGVAATGAGRDGAGGITRCAIRPRQAGPVRDRGVGNRGARRHARIQLCDIDDRDGAARRHFFERNIQHGGHAAVQLSQHRRTGHRRDGCNAQVDQTCGKRVRHQRIKRAAHVITRGVGNRQGEFNDIARITAGGNRIFNDRHLRLRNAHLHVGGSVQRDGAIENCETVVAVFAGIIAAGSAVIDQRIEFDNQEFRIGVAVAVGGRAECEGRIVAVSERPASHGRGRQDKNDRGGWHGSQRGIIARDGGNARHIG